jgi:chromosome partitioning protein
MSYTVAVTNHKGGVAKTTTAVSLGVEWRARGLSVLIVDTDPQRHVVTWLGLAAERGGHALEHAPVVRAMPAAKLAKQLRKIGEGFDVVIVDTPPQLADVQAAAAAMADLMVIPTGSTAQEMWALYDAAALARAEMKRRPACIAVALLTRWDGQTLMGRHAEAAIAEVGLPTLETKCCYRVDYGYAFAAGLGVTEYAPKSAAASEVRQLATELEELADGRIPRRGAAADKRAVRSAEVRT